MFSHWNQYPKINQVSIVKNVLEKNYIDNFSTYKDNYPVREKKLSTLNIVFKFSEGHLCYKIRLHKLQIIHKNQMQPSFCSFTPMTNNLSELR